MLNKFNLWLERMGFAGCGGQKKAAQALGVSTAMIRNYENGKISDGRPVEYPRTLDPSRAALAQGIKPWSEHER